MKPKFARLSLGDGSLANYNYLMSSAGIDCIMTSLRFRLRGLLAWPSTGFVMASKDSSMSCHFRLKKFLLTVTLLQAAKSYDD